MFTSALDEVPGPAVVERLRTAVNCAAGVVRLTVFTSPTSGTLPLPAIVFLRLRFRFRADPRVGGKARAEMSIEHCVQGVRTLEERQVSGVFQVNAPALGIARRMSFAQRLNASASSSPTRTSVLAPIRDRSAPPERVNACIHRRPVRSTNDRSRSRGGASTTLAVSLRL